MTRAHIREATLDDVSSIVELTNEAFMEDAYFKKPEFWLRTSADFVRDCLQSTKNETFLVYCEATEEDMANSKESEVILGSVRVEWDESTRIGHFGHVSVSKARRKAGIGRQLVQAAEQFCLKKLNGPYHMEIPIIDSRVELLRWYGNQGYSRTGTREFSAPEIVRDGFHVHLILFSKAIGS